MLIRATAVSYAAKVISKAQINFLSFQLGRTLNVMGRFSQATKIHFPHALPCYGMHLFKSVGCQTPNEYFNAF